MLRGNTCNVKSNPVCVSNPACVALQPRVACPVDDSHASGANLGGNFIRADASARGQRHDSGWNSGIIVRRLFRLHSGLNVRTSRASLVAAYNKSVTREPDGLPPAVNADTARAALQEAVEREPDVAGAYLFGSLVRNTAGPLSDVDVALLVCDAGMRVAVCDRVLDALTRRLRTSRIDVISLTEAMLPLRYRVIREGSLVLCRDVRAVERFVVDTVLQYLDFKQLRDRAFEVTRRAILERQ